MVVFKLPQPPSLSLTFARLAPAGIPCFTMRTSERLIVYGLLALALVGASRGLPGLAPTAIATQPAPTPSIPTTRLATCDVYALVEKLVDSDTYAPARKSEEARITALLEPAQTELQRLQAELQAINPQDPAAQAAGQQKFQAFEAKRQEFNTQREAMAADYTKLVSSQFIDAYTKIAAQAKLVAAQRGYTHVISQKSGAMLATDPRRLVEDFLARPITVAPDGSDLTDAVRVAMNLPELTAKPDTAPQANTPATPLTPLTPAVPEGPK